MHYPWTRYWYSNMHDPTLDVFGFLEGPAAWRESELTTLDALMEESCLILLGEPGAGKSYELSTEENRLAHTGHRTLSLDLGDYGSDEQLVKAIVGSGPWQEWLAGTDRLYLFLDGLDEGRLLIPTLTETTLSVLREAPLDRLALRISCRAADWPASLESRLEKLLDSKECPKPHILRLAVLRQADIKAAVEARQMINPDLFLDLIKDLRVGALAARPVTLELLLRIWNRTGGNLPVDQRDLYEQGCLELCREPDGERREKGEAHSQFRWPDPYTLLDAAAWVAALTQLGNYPLISRADDPMDDPESLPVMGLCRKELAQAGHPVYDRQLLTCLLRTGLFCGRGRDRYAWAHRTYAEFLVSRLLRNVPLMQVQALLIHPYGDGTNLVPQLHETAAWLATCRKDMFNWLLEHQPMVLLRSDVVLPDSAKGQLVDHVLGEAVEGRLMVGGDWVRKLVYPGLAVQLEPIICDRQLGRNERLNALRLAYFARVADIVPTCVRIALDQTEPVDLRIDAADNVRHLGTFEVLGMLEPLARGGAVNDPNDELKGIGLQCMWPRFWSAPTVIEQLKDPQSRYHFGRYRRFLIDFPGSIPDSEIGPALLSAKDWSLPHDGQRLDIFRQLVVRSWELRNQESVLVPLGYAVMAMIRQHHMLPIDVGEDHVYRRRLVEVLINECGITDEDVARLVSRRLVHSDEILWALEQASRALGRSASIWAAIIGELVHRGVDTVGRWSDALENARQCNPSIAPHVAWLYEIWDLGSQKARSAKARYLCHLRLEKRLRPKVLSPSPLVRVARELERIEAGEAHHWPHVCFWMGVNPDAPEAPVFVEDLEETPGWKVATSELHARIQEAAKRYILECRPPGETWMGEGEIDNRGLEAYPAFRLVASDAFVYRIPAKTWSYWVPILISFPTNNRDALHRMLTALTYHMAPDAVIEHVWRHLETGDPYFINNLGHCWDDRLSNVAFAALKRPELAPRSREYLVPKLIEHKYPPVFTWLVSELARPLGDDEPWLVKTANYLVHAGVENAWPILQELFESRPEFGQQVCLSLAHDRWMHGNSQFPQAYCESDLGQLWHWFYTFFPYQTDPRVSGPRRITPREDAGRLRDELLYHLANRGTEAACAVLQGLEQCHPEAAEHIRVLLPLAEENTRRNTWIPPTPQTIAALLSNRDKRYIASADQLLDVVIETLERIQVQVLGRWNPVNLLWDQNRVQPKDEQALSDFLAHRLHDELVTKGVVVNREVEIKHGRGRPGARTPGLRTDILVEALPKDPNGDARRVAVIIEVKGCWHQDLKTAMKTQLVERYLHDDHCSRGIYLVGWFRCDAWDPEDYRFSDTPNMTLDEVRSLLDGQAEALMQQHSDLRIRAVAMDLRLQR